MRILTVEDDVELQGYIRQILEMAGYEYDSAVSTDEYRKLIASKHYDLALLDLSLGERKNDGVEICKEIKANYPDTAVMILSGTGDADIKVTTLNIGADDYVTKPFYDEELLSRIKRIAQRRDITLPDKELRIKFDDKMTTAIIDGKKVPLEKDEYLILKILNSRFENGIKWEHLYNIVYDDGEKSKKTVDKKTEAIQGKLGGLVGIHDENGFYRLSFKGVDGAAAVKKKKVLIVDDDDNTQELVRGILEEGQFECFSSYDGNDGLKKIYELKPDLVVIDIKLPGINGLKLCELVKKINPNLPLVILTGRFVDPSDRALGLDLGADDYISKAIAPDELLARIKTIMSAYEIKSRK